MLCCLLAILVRKFTKATCHFLLFCLNTCFRDLSNNQLTKLPAGGDFSDLTVPNRTDIEYTMDFSGNRINALPSNVFKNLTMGNTL